MSKDLDKKDAKLVMKLKAESGYSCTQEDIISVNQWKDINLVITGKLKSSKSNKFINEQVEILKDTLEEMMTGFDTEEDKIDFILDICNGYKKRISS